MRNLKTIPVFMLAVAFILSGCLGADDTPDANGDDAQADPGTNGASAEEGNATNGTILEDSTSWLIGITGCLNLVFVDATAGLDAGWINIPSDAHGQAFNATFESVAPAVMYGVTFSGDGSFLESFDSMDPVVEGTVPSDAEVAIFWSCLGVENSVSFTVTASG